MKIKFFFSIWIISILITIVYVYENPEKIDAIKKFIKNEDVQIPDIKDLSIIKANSFDIKLEEIIKFDNGFKTSFVTFDYKKKEEEKNIKINDLIIYFQNGSVIKKNLKISQIEFENFTDDFNGGIKNIFIYDNVEFAYLTMYQKDCYYVSILNLSDNKEIFKSECLPDGEINFNGVGGASLHLEESILLSIGVPGWNGVEIAKLAQNPKSFFGKIIQIDKDQLDQIILNKTEKIEPKIFSLGHRNPQGLTKLNNKIFSTEHGPKGGDELNLILEGKNYGWPISSYGIKYDFDYSDSKYFKSHEDHGFKEPLFALVPSIGLSSLNNCSTIIKKFYNKPCLMALSLWGNELRQGKSLIIYLLDKKMQKVISTEKIFLGNEYPLRHFVTFKDNKLYEDTNGDIFVSVDGKGIFKLKFVIESSD